MQDPNFDHQPANVRIVAVVSAALVVFGCAIAGFFMTAEGSGMPSFLEDFLDVLVMAWPEGFTIQQGIGWFLIVEGAVWLLGAGVYLAVKLPGIEDGPEAEALRQLSRQPERRR